MIRTDGTAAGTRQLSLGATRGADAEGTVHGGKLYFVSYTAPNWVLRRTDGTTVEVVDAANAGAGGVLHACGTTLFYSSVSSTGAPSTSTWQLRALVNGSGDAGRERRGALFLRHEGGLHREQAPLLADDGG